jgi:hypothetical protein
MMTEEEILIKSFIIKNKRERFTNLLANPKQRVKVTSSLAHFSNLDPRWVVKLLSDQQNAVSIERILRSKGAGDTCYVISESKELDGKRFSLRTVLDQIIGYGMGTLLSCVPGMLAFYEGESPSNRCILERSAI